MAETDAPIRWLTQSATGAFTIQRGRVEQGTLCLSHSVRTDRVEIGYQLDLPAGMDIAAVMAAAEAADPDTEEFWRWGSTVPFTPSSTDFVHGLSTAHALIEAARTRSTLASADAALARAGFVRRYAAGPDVTYWNLKVAGGSYSLELYDGNVALSFDARGSSARRSILRLTIHRLGQKHRIHNFWPSFMQSRNALLAIGIDAAERCEHQRKTTTA